MTNVVTPVPASGQSAQTTITWYNTSLRAWKVTQPDGTCVTNSYDLAGQLTNTCGSRTYPVAYTYDVQGRMKTMTTWTNYGSRSGSATTKWYYDDCRGWLTNKAYADNSSVLYSNTPAGRSSTRTWARGLTTTYAYDYVLRTFLTSYILPNWHPSNPDCSAGAVVKPGG